MEVGEGLFAGAHFEDWGFLPGCEHAWRVGAWLLKHPPVTIEPLFCHPFCVFTIIVPEDLHLIGDALDKQDKAVQVAHNQIECPWIGRLL